LQWGIADVDGWLSTLPKGTLDKWLAFDAVEPIGEQRLQHAELLAVLYRLTAVTLAAHGQGMDPIQIEGYMPSRYEPETKPKKPKPSEAIPQVASIFGLTEVVKQHGRINQPS
jgi:hypothetical protein